MKAREIDLRLRDADRFSAREMERLELGTATAALAEAILAEPARPTAAEAVSPPWSTVRRRRRSLFGVAGVAAAAVAAALVLLVVGGSSQSPSRAYGAQLVRFAESTPLLLLESPGWRVQNVNQFEGGDGRMEFVTGEPIPHESVRLTPEGVSGMAPPSVRQRKVELSWRDGKAAFPMSAPDPTELPVLDTTAQVNTRAGEMYVVTENGKRVFNRGKPGDRTMAAAWREGSRVIELRAAVPNLAAFEERLGWLTRVDSQTWLDAMPAKVVKAADHDDAVREMLRGIPVPDGFRPSQVRGADLTTSRYQVGAAVTGTVSCLWFRQWGEARRAGDERAALEAERAMATSERWPILREMAKEGGYPQTVWDLAAAMPSGHGRRGWRLLPQAETLGCARMGIPVLPWKQRRQRERGSL